MDFKYKINKIEFEQRELTFGEDGMVFELIKEKMPFLESIENTPILDIVKEIISGGAVIPLLRIILKEKKTLKNKITKIIFNTNIEDCYNKIPNSILIQIFKDFFLLNLSWIGEVLQLKKD